MDCKIGDIISLDEEFQLVCYKITKRKSYWVAKQHIHHKILWWEWNSWEEYEYSLEYAPMCRSYFTLTIEMDLNEPIELLFLLAESELNFLGEDVDYSEKYDSYFHN